MQKMTMCRMQSTDLVLNNGQNTEIKVAIIHYWLVGMRGGEKVLEAFCRLFPNADIYTHSYLPENMSQTIRRHNVRETLVGRLPLSHRLYQYYLPLMPMALEAIDLSSYDLVISSESGPAKGVIPKPTAFHLCYTHTPMRYLWDQYNLYRSRSGPLNRIAMPLLMPRLRMWDVTSAARVDHFVANSRHVAQRIQKYWRRDAEVVHPPVDLSRFSPLPRAGLGDFFLWVGELVPYKRPDIAIDAFRRLGLPLVVIGGPGKMSRRLAQDASNITFLGPTDFPTLRDHMARCRALVFPGEEDFGIVPVEAMASGRPVIAYRSGGALDTVVHGETGYLFAEQSVDALVAAVEDFQRLGLDDLPSERLRLQASRFDEAHFRDGISRALRRGGIDIGTKPSPLLEDDSICE